MHEAARFPVIQVVAVAGIFGVWIWMHRRATRRAAARWRDRPPLSDDGFLKSCGVPDDPFRIKVALAARSSIARLGTVPPETIEPNDSFAKDLVQLPFWDSLDWLTLVFEMDKKLGFRAIPANDFIDSAVKLAGGRAAELKVEHVVRALVLTARQPGQKPTDEGGSSTENEGPVRS